MRHIDWWIFLPALFLSILGLVTLFSAAPTFFRSQVIFLSLSLIFFFLISQIDISFFIEFSAVAYFLSLLLLSLTLFFGFVSRGAIRWLGIPGLRFQPSEIVKPLLILFFAKFINLIDLRKFTGFFKALIVLLPPLFLIFLQPDLGSTFVILAIWLGVVLAKSIDLKIILGGALMFVLSFPFLWHILVPYQKERIIHFLNPGKDPLGASYSQVQAEISIGSGSFWGKGLGQGTQSVLKFLPEYQTDFIFATFAEEWGFIGVVVLLGLYLVLFTRLLSLASQVKEEKGLIFMGVFTFLFFQFTVHSAMNLGILPISGITLPFISAGGSSLLASWISLGIVMSIKPNS